MERKAMPTSNELSRHFAMSYAELYETAMRIAKAMQRDIDDLSQFGITESKITVLNDLIEDYLEHLNDEVYKADYMYAVQDRQMKRDALNKVLKRIGISAEIVFKNNYATMSSLVFENMSKTTDAEFAVTASKIHTNAVKNLSALASQLITAEYLATMQTMITQFSISITEARTKLDIRENKTEERIILANTIYDNLVDVCKYGKLLYEDVSPAKYNDYLLTPVQPGSLKSPTNLIYNIKDTTLTWDIVLHATSYIVEYSQDGEHFTEVYIGAETFCIYTPPVEGWGYYRVRGRNSGGYGPYSTVLKQGYYAILPPPSNVTAEKVQNTSNVVRIKWDEVPSATKYALYISTVPIGSPANSYLFVSREPRTMEEMELEVGKRHWFEVTAESNVQWSKRSNAIYIDL